MMARWAIAVFLLAASGSAARLAYADWLGEQGRIAESLRIWPGRAELWLRLAEAQPEREAEAVERAVQEGPHSSAAWMARGLVHEFAGDLSAAQRDLERAASTDRGFRPRWARMNYFLRRGDEAGFWRAAREAAPWTYGDRRAFFELCWRMRPDARVVFQEIRPRTASVLFDFILFAKQQGDAGVAHEAFQLLAGLPYGSVARANAGRVATREERRHLGLDLCDWELDLGLGRAAQRTWETMTRQGLAAGSPGRGFDWRVLTREESGVHLGREGQGWRIEFSGSQADTVRLLRRAVVLPGPGRFRVRSGVTPAANLEWVLTPAGEAAWIELRYVRPPGSVRARGTVRVRGIELEKAGNS
jgi:uncharacterized protein (TIGR02996 family)